MEDVCKVGHKKISGLKNFPLRKNLVTSSLKVEPEISM